LFGTAEGASEIKGVVKRNYNCEIRLDEGDFIRVLPGNETPVNYKQNK
jgi:hypothetical protein